MVVVRYWRKMAMEVEAAGVSDVRKVAESFSWLAEMTLTSLGKRSLLMAALSSEMGTAFSV